MDVFLLELITPLLVSWALFVLALHFGDMICISEPLLLLALLFLFGSGLQFWVDDYALGVVALATSAFAMVLLLWALDKKIEENTEERKCQHEPGLAKVSLSFDSNKAF